MHELISVSLVSDYTRNGIFFCAALFPAGRDIGTKGAKEAGGVRGGLLRQLFPDACGGVAAAPFLIAAS